MQYITTSANLKMPALIYGTAWKKEKTADYVTQALAAGFVGIDTACQPKHYYEPGVGQALQGYFEQGHSRDSVYIQTKFTPLSGHDPNNIPYDPKEPLPNQVMSSFAVSQQNLGVETIDSLVLHSPLATAHELMSVWQTMESLVEQGAVGQIGISNCYDVNLLGFLNDNAEIKPAVLQNRFHEQTHYDGALREYCDAHAIVYQSFWTLTANPHILASPQISELATAHSKTPAQILFRALTQIGIAPLTGTTNPMHMAQDIAIFEFSLQPQELTAVIGLWGQ